MKKITLLGVMVILCARLFGQDYGYDLRTVDAPLFIGDYVKRSIPLGKFVNYKDETATIADFEGRMLIVGFWFTSCASCIAMFPKEDALQEQFNKHIQFILVTYEPEQKVRAFIKEWEVKNSSRFRMPVIVEDTLLRKTIRNFANPSYAWLLSTGKLVAQTTEDFISNYGINAVLHSLAEEERRSKSKARIRTTNPIR